MLTPAAQEFYDQLEPAIEGDEQEVEDLVSAFAKPFERLYDLANGGTAGLSPWKLAGDVYNAPDWLLPYLANYAGIAVDGLSSDDLRQAIKTRPQQRVGRPTTIVDELKKYLTGTKKVILLERTPTPYEFTIYSLATETPDEAEALAALKKVKPARLLMHYQALAAPTWGMVESHYDTWQDVDDAYDTWNDLASDQSIIE